MFRRTALVFFVAAAMALPGSNYQRDWAAHPAIAKRPSATTIYAMGDVHGDYERMATLLSAAHIIEGKSLRWSAGKSVLVVTGDMIDKGPRQEDVVHFLVALKADALKSGGEVILLNGNHEAKFLAGAGAADSDLGKVFRDLPFAAKVGDWFFSHGGNTAGQTIPQISEAIRLGVDRDGFGAKVLAAPDSLLEARLGEGKAQWIESADQKALLEKYASALGVKHMAQGHQHNEVRFDDGTTRKAGQMFCKWGLLCLIDVGMSREIDDSTGAILKITALQIEAVYPDGSEKPLAASI
jgi:hypothetical protein